MSAPAENIVQSEEAAPSIPDGTGAPKPDSNATDGYQHQTQAPDAKKDAFAGIHPDFLTGTDDRKSKSGKAAADKNATEFAGQLKHFFATEEKEEVKEKKPLRRPKKIFHNSYRLESHVPYSRDKVQKILDNTVEEMMEGVKYNADTANEIAVRVAERIRKRILELKFDRYKIIVMTNVGSANRQGVHMGFRCLWDVERDTYNFANFNNGHAFINAIVYAMYYE